MLDPVSAPEPEKPPREWRIILDQLMAEPTSCPESIGHAHNGFQVDAPEAGRQGEPGARGRHAREAD
jgi:hypothetical protein